MAEIWLTTWDGAKTQQIMGHLPYQLVDFSPHGSNHRTRPPTPRFHLGLMVVAFTPWEFATNIRSGQFMK